MNEKIEDKLKELEQIKETAKQLIEEYNDNEDQTTENIYNFVFELAKNS
ncbi:MAG: hypothetical protein ACTSYG_08520 [Candidatus Heimdallarchaeota archaeon]